MRSEKELGSLALIFEPKAGGFIPSHRIWVTYPFVTAAVKKQGKQGDAWDTDIRQSWLCMYFDTRFYCNWDHDTPFFTISLKVLGFGIGYSYQNGY